MSGWTYAKSGVNIDQKSEAIKALVDEVSYKRSGIGQAVRLPGLFASLVDFGDRYITMATDGVGSKLLIAEALNKWDTVGIDCIAMNVNDTICVNAEPTSFVDYIAIDEPKPEITEEIGKGLQKGAELSDMEIVGGEIAVLPEIINGVDLSGTCMGYVEKDRIITGETCAEGDLIIGLESSGIHSNGLTLARKVVEANGIALTDHVKGLSKTIGEELLTPTEIYVRQVLGITRSHEVHGLVDITGGGLRNILRMRKGLRYVIDDPIEPAPVFTALQELGDITTEEIYQTLNMSMGFTIIAPADEAEAIAAENRNAKIVGRVEKGEGDATQTIANFTNKDEVKVLNEDIRFIKQNEVKLTPRGQFFFGTLGYWLFYLIPTLVFIIFFILYRKQIAANANVAKVRTKKANKVAVKRLKLAGKLLSDNKKDEFYDEVLKALWGYVSDKLSIPMSRLSKDNVEEELRNYGVAEELIAGFLKVLDNCEFARFAPSDANQGMDKIYAEALDIISKMEGSIKH